MIIIFAGAIGRSGLGGQAWSDMQYLAGFRALGHDVYYLEDNGLTSWAWDWEKGELTTALDYPAQFVSTCLEPIGLGDRWIYRAGEATLESRGMPLEELLAVCEKADLLVMRSAPMWLWRPEYDLPRRRIFIDVDPGFTQIKLANGNAGLVEGLNRCERYFTIGQGIGAPDCPIPTAGRTWLKTIPPVALGEWPVTSGSPATHFTTVMNWRGFDDVTYEGVLYGTKEKEFPKYIDLPRQTTQPLRLAVMGVEPELLTGHGWDVVPSWEISRTPASYRGFIQESRAEFGVAKHAYVSTRSGWFSDRSICYLASGRPVLVSDTRLSDWLPIGNGLLTFRDLPEAVAGIDEINADYQRHCIAARRLAEDYFAAERVLPDLLGKSMD
jgi:hypothetical protein